MSLTTIKSIVESVGEEKAARAANLLFTRVYSTNTICPCCIKGMSSESDSCGCNEGSSSIPDGWGQTLICGCGDWTVVTGRCSDPGISATECISEVTQPDMHHVSWHDYELRNRPERFFPPGQIPADWPTPLYIGGTDYNTSVHHKVRFTGYSLLVTKSGFYDMFVDGDDTFSTPICLDAQGDIRPLNCWNAGRGVTVTLYLEAGYHKNAFSGVWESTDSWPGRFATGIILFKWNEADNNAIGNGGATVIGEVSQTTQQTTGTGVSPMHTQSTTSVVKPPSFVYLKSDEGAYEESSSPTV